MRDDKVLLAKISNISRELLLKRKELLEKKQDIFFPDEDDGMLNEEYALDFHISQLNTLRFEYLEKKLTEAKTPVPSMAYDADLWELSARCNYYPSDEIIVKMESALEEARNEIGRNRSYLISQRSLYVAIIALIVSLVPILKDAFDCLKAAETSPVNSVAPEKLNSN
ncbi:hypothetical protein [Paenirhodobacter enshiensis]|uniref:hypothetical protein n=1 Tax=Paenirhodobacter enshiensis TaxID=1105367 RepID=UPI001269051E|nr:hypothetical protein [Paenirhodobacter enshiensis]